MWCENIMFLSGTVSINTLAFLSGTRCHWWINTRNTAQYILYNALLNLSILFAGLVGLQEGVWRRPGGLRWAVGKWRAETSVQSIGTGIEGWNSDGWWGDVSKTVFIRSCGFFHALVLKKGIWSLDQNCQKSCKSKDEIYIHELNNKWCRWEVFIGQIFCNFYATCLAHKHTRDWVNSLFQLCFSFQPSVDRIPEKLREKYGNSLMKANNVMKSERHVGIGLDKTEESHLLEVFDDWHLWRGVGFVRLSVY